MEKSVLVISNNCFSSSTNNGKTLESIFSGYKINNLSQLYFTDIISPDFDFCNRYFRIFDVDVFRSRFLGKSKCGDKVGKSFFNKEIVSSNKKDYLNSPVFGVAFLRLLRDLLWKTNKWKSLDLEEWSKSLKVDYVFFVAGGSTFSYKVANYLASFLNVPIVTFFTDDYLIYPQKNNLFDWIQYNRLNKIAKNTVAGSSLCFAIGNAMSKTYSNYFDKYFYQIMNSVSFKEYSEKGNSESKISINYFGSLHTNRWRMIVKLAKILKTYNIDDVQINVYVANQPNVKIINAFLKVGIVYKGSVFGQNLINSISQSDILLHIESDDSNSVSKTKLSISTKIPEYLMSGRPILGYGPSGVASMQLLEENQVGVVISTTDNEEDVYRKLHSITKSFEFRREIGKKGYDFAINNFNNGLITRNFQLIIEQALNENKNSNNNK